MRKIWRKPKKVEEKKFRINNQIRAAQVFLINEEGEHAGILSLNDAMQRAEEFGMDLVEVNPKAEPPVVKIMDYGQFKYEIDKKAHKQKVKQKKIDTKGIRLSVRIDEHDFNFRKDQAIKFLSKGNKLKVELQLKGRERQHPQKALEVMNRFISSLESKSDFSLVREQDLTKQGDKYNIILVNKIK
jgi:translation initiation factor IF-3